METQTRLSRHNKFISAENIVYSPSRQMPIYMLLSRLRPSRPRTVTGYFKDIYIYIYICIYIFIIYCVKSRAIPCPHQPPNGVITDFGSSRWYCHSWRYQAACAT